MLSGAALAERRRPDSGAGGFGHPHDPAFRQRARHGLACGRGRVLLCRENRLRTFDVLIAGGGPAGCAAAIALSRHAPELSVCIADAPRDDAPALGETLPPPAAAMLKQLGVHECFVADGHERAFRTV